MSYKAIHSGDANTTDYRVYLERDGKIVSYLNDVPLLADAEKGIYNMIVEIPRGTNAKMEINLSTPANPIKQDVKNGKLRFVDDVYPYTGYIWNYGALPQTWESPNHVNPDTGYAGDNDPLDVCDIGQAVGVRGEIKQVKVLGSLALIDEGETDWKIIAIDVNDPRADQFNDISDVERLLPGFTLATYEWFRTYKIPAGKPPNEFAFNGATRDRAYTLNVIEENSRFWKELTTGAVPPKGDKYDIACQNVSVEDSVHRVEAFDIEFQPVVDASARDSSVRDSTGIKAHVEQQQITSPHGTAELSSVVAALALAAAKGAESGVDGIVQVLKNAPLAALYSSESNDALATNNERQYTVYFHAKDGVVVFGAYHKATPHRIPFSLSDEVEAAGYDLVAAAFASAGKFTYTTRHGVFTFTADGPVGSDDVEKVPQVSGDSLLAVRAPLAFFQ